LGYQVHCAIIVAAAIQKTIPKAVSEFFVANLRYPARLLVVIFVLIFFKIWYLFLKPWRELVNGILGELYL
jgi:hypothetical protein